MEVKLETSVTFDFTTSRFDTGAVTDADPTPSFEVFEGDTDTALTLSTSSIAKRTGKTGNYRATFTVAGADGFEAGKWYNVVASATVNSVSGKGVIGRFRPVENLLVDGVNVTQWDGHAVPAHSHAEGMPVVEVHYVQADAALANPIHAITDDGKRIAAAVDVAATGIVEEYLPVEHADSKVTEGDVTGAFSAGDITNLGNLNASYVTIGESANGIDAQLRFSGIEAVDVPSEVHIYGRYEGNVSHYVAVMAWNYRTGAWEYLAPLSSAAMIPHTTANQHYRFPLRQAHFDNVNGVTLIRFLHVGTGNNAHTGLVLDKVSCDFTYAEGLAEAIQAGLDAQGYTAARAAYLDDLDAPVSGIPTADAATPASAAQAAAEAVKGYIEAMTVGGLGAVFTPEAVANFVAAIPRDMSRIVGVESATTLDLGLDREATNIGGTLTISCLTADGEVALGTYDSVNGWVQDGGWTDPVTGYLKAALDSNGGPQKDPGDPLPVTITISAGGDAITYPHQTFPGLVIPAVGISGGAWHWNYDGSLAALYTDAFSPGQIRGAMLNRAELLDNDNGIPHLVWYYHEDGDSAPAWTRLKHTAYTRDLMGAGFWDGTQSDPVTFSWSGDGSLLQGGLSSMDERYLEWRILYDLDAGVFTKTQDFTTMGDGRGKLYLSLRSVGGDTAAQTLTITPVAAGVGQDAPIVLRIPAIASGKTLNAYFDKDGWPVAYNGDYVLQPTGVASDNSDALSALKQLFSAVCVRLPSDITDVVTDRVLAAGEVITIYSWDITAATWAESPGGQMYLTGGLEVYGTLDENGWTPNVGFSGDFKFLAWNVASLGSEVLVTIETTNHGDFGLPVDEDGDFVLSRNGSALRFKDYVYGADRADTTGAVVGGLTLNQIEQSDVLLKKTGASPTNEVSVGANNDVLATIQALSATAIVDAIVLAVGDPATLAEISELLAERATTAQAIQERMDAYSTKLADIVEDTNELQQRSYAMTGGTNVFTSAALANAPTAAVVGGIGTGNIRFTWSEYEDGHSGDPAHAVRDVVVAAYNNSSAEGDVIASAVTDEDGKARLYLDEGTYYLFRRKAGRAFSNPVQISVSRSQGDEVEPLPGTYYEFTWTEFETGHDGDPNYVVADVDVRVMTVNDEDATPVETGRTGSDGTVVFDLAAGTYYLFRSKTGRSFTNPATIVVGP